MPALRVSVNSGHQSTLSLSGPGVLLCTVGWVDTSDQPLSADRQSEFYLSLGGVDKATHETLNWPNVDLQVGDVIAVEGVAEEPSSPEPNGP